jgi:AcrR family transcriptional regulator
MFMKNKPPAQPIESRRSVGRPRGTSAAGLEMRETLYATAIRLFTERGYDETTLRDIANEAGVSAGLLYRYYPGKRALVLDLYERLSAAYAAQSSSMPSGAWQARFLFALHKSLEVLGPYREALAALLPTLVGNREEGVLSLASAACRVAVQAVFEEAVAGARNAPGTAHEAAALGRSLYLAHLGVLLFWALDRSERQRATQALLAVVRRSLPMAALAMKLGLVRELVREVDAAATNGLFSDDDGGPR